MNLPVADRRSAPTARPQCSLVPMPLRKSGTVRTHRSEGERGHPARISLHLAGVREKPLVCVLLRRPPARCRRQRAGSPCSPSTPCASVFSGVDSLEVSAVEGVVISLQALSLGPCITISVASAGGDFSIFQGANERQYPHGSCPSKQRGKIGIAPPALRVAMKMGWRLRCGSVTARSGDAPSPRLAGSPF